jgi:hypothetical protein
MAAMSSRVAGVPPSLSQLNDAFRRTLTGGRVVVSSGVAHLGEDELARLLTGVAGFEAFDTGNDPYGERDFGAIEQDGARYFWKIDYYDRDFAYGSPDPANSAVTARVLTIMLAEEY